MKDIAIYGAGGFGREVACLIKKINESCETPVWNFIGFFDDGKEKGSLIGHFGKCLGGLNELNEWKSTIDICIAIGKGVTIEKIVRNITNTLVDYPNIVDPDVLCYDKLTFKLGKGNIIKYNCSFSCDVSVGDFNMFVSNVGIGHDVLIGNYNVFMPSVRISGEVKIGNNNLFGVGSKTIQKLTIKNNTIIAPGSVLMTKPKENSLYIGIPAKLMRL